MADMSEVVDLVRFLTTGFGQIKNPMVGFGNLIDEHY
jgi:hypothetical protein